MGSNTGLDVAVIGGSLSGSMAEIALSRAGHKVRVYERSQRGLVGRGGGVTTSDTVFRRLQSLDLIDADFPSCRYAALYLSKIAEGESDYGRCPITPPLAMHCVHWSGLWENMRKRIPDAAYVNGRTLSAVAETGDGVHITFEGGARERADLVLFADGYSSFGRRLMFPEAQLDYRGFTVWRGVVPESEISPAPHLELHPRISLKTMPGSFICYLIPNREGSVRAGERIFNWALYFPLPQKDLAAFMVDNEGQRRVGTVPAGAMRPEADDALKEMLQDELPTYFADIVARSRNNQIQQIYTCDLDAYAKGRMCLLGDAGILVPPLTGGGLYKSLSNAVDLVEALARDVPLETALSDWSNAQTGAAKSLLLMGLDMERAFIWDTIDLATESHEECAAWFDRSIRIAREFSYFAL